MLKLNSVPFGKVRNVSEHPLVQNYLKSLEISDDTKSVLAYGWGYKRSGLKAIKSDKDFVLFEDGFVRSMFPGYKMGLPYSIVVDYSGIYYDLEGNSDLIKYLNGEAVKGEQWYKTISKETISTTLSLVRRSGVSKYNCHLNSERHFERGVVVVDQTSGDTAIQCSGMDESDFDRMLKDAILENPDTPIYVKTHPDHEFRKKNSCFSEDLMQSASIKILPSDVSSAECFVFCDKVYVGTSLMGMEGLIHKSHVITYGWSFYTGWGLTEDRASSAKPPRNKSVSLEKLFEAAYLRYTHYYDPDTNERCDINRIIDHIKLQWKHWNLGRGDWVGFGLSPWKKQMLPKYLGRKVGKVSHNTKICNEDSRLITWGAKEVSSEFTRASVTRIEDGFIRSRGLGANFNFPLSWVFDDRGIYFDSRSESKIENLLERHQFSECELQQAEELISFLRKNKLTKYNLGIKGVTMPVEAKGKKVILIPGQVDSDASIKYGSPKLSDSLALIREVRRQHPDSYICYKPHPDLISGARKGVALWKGIEDDVDHIALDGDVISWIQAVDEVHTLTSTVGFEALIHGKPVYTYGLPFYAGWGLTEDWLKCSRRTTKCSLVELVYAALILYPTYLNPKTGEFTSALNAAKLLIDPNFSYDSRSGFLMILGKVKAWFNKLIRN